MQDLPAEFVRKVQSSFLDALYAFLDGLVHVAFSDPDAIFTSGKQLATRRAPFEADESGRPKEVDIRNVVSRVGRGASPDRD